MKKTLLIAAFTLVQLALWAVPAKRGIWRDITLADGTRLRVELRGDEFGSFWRSDDGRCFVKDLSADRYVLTDQTTLTARADAMREAMYAGSVRDGQAKAPARVSIGGSHPAFKGSKKGLIILVEFTDKKFMPEHTVEYYRGIANSLTDKHRADGFVGSIHDYYYDQSEGQFDLTFDVVGPIQLKNNMEYYGGHTQNGNDKNPGAMIVEAVEGASKLLPDFSPYDWFGDGYVDQVFVVYAGRGEADGGDENTIWPHRSQFGYARTYSGKKVQVYACSNELRDEDKINGIGTFCHEFSHCLGLPDLYDTQYGGNYGMSYWDIMNSGCYLDDAMRPCAYSGYERNYCGWKQPIVLTDDCEVTGMRGISEGGDYYIIYNDAHKDEYYVLENRSRTGWDAGQFGAGLLITHIDFDKKLWANNCVNVVNENNDHERYAVVTADNNTRENSTTDIAGDLYPYKGNTWFTNRSVPASTLYNANTDGTRLLSKPVTQITRNSTDGTVSFTFRNEVGKEVDTLPEGVLFRETFDECYGEGGNDGNWAPKTTEVTITDNAGWTSTYMYGADKCARFGTNVQRGTVTTPEIEIDGEAVLTFKAAPYTGEASTLTLSVSSGSATLSQATCQLAKGQWTDHKVVLTGSGKVKIQMRSNKARFFLDEVYVVTPDYDAIEAANADTATAKAYNLQGMPVAAGYRGIVILNGRKVVVR